MNKKEIQILQPAQQEIMEIVAVHVELAGKQSAQKLMHKLYKAFGQLAIFPLSGALSTDKELCIAGYRMLVIGQYLCIYRVIEDVVYIYHIVHGTMNYPKLWKKLAKQS